MPDIHQPARWRARRSAGSRHDGLVPEYLKPSSIAAVRELAELFAAAEWAPSSYRGNDGKYVTEKIVLGIMHGAAVGLGPFAAVHAIAVIDGHPTIWGDGALALVERSGLIQDMCEDYLVDGEEGVTAICTMRRHPWPTPITRRFSMAMAEEAGLTKKEGPWQTYPRRMLMMRARSWALRDGFADVLRGLSIREEVEDYDRERVPLPVPTPFPSHGHATPACRRGAPRPRLADYVAASATELNRKPRSNVGTMSAANRDAMGSCTPPGSVAEDTSRPVIYPPTETKNHTGDGMIGTDRLQQMTEPGEAPAPVSALGADAPQLAVEEVAPYSLIDAEGSFIEVGALEELRAAFERLFANRCLSADHIIGLWESNELARQQLTDVFGETALNEARSRYLSAVESGNARSFASMTKPTRRRSRSKQPKIVGTAPITEVDLSLKIDPSWSDEKLLHHYQARLLAMRLRREKAETFVNFRLANQAVEDRLRARLLHLMAPIHEVYAWASIQSS